MSNLQIELFWFFTHDNEKSIFFHNFQLVQINDFYKFEFLSAFSCHIFICFLNVCQSFRKEIHLIKTINCDRSSKV